AHCRQPCWGEQRSSKQGLACRRKPGAAASPLTPTAASSSSPSPFPATAKTFKLMPARGGSSALLAPPDREKTPEQVDPVRRTAMRPDEHYRNRELGPGEELRKHSGRLVGWSMDGPRIVASGLDHGSVLAAAREAGFGPDEIVISYLPAP